MSTETKVPTQPSNRQFCNQMVLWGWEVEKRRSDGWMMRHLLSGVLVTIQAPTQHEANPSSTFKNVVQVTCGGDRERFWCRTESVKDEQAAKVRLRIAADLASAAFKRADASRHVPGPNLEDNIPDTGLTGDKPKRATPTRGVSTKVLEVLISRRNAMTVQQLRRALPGISEGAVAGAAAYLAKNGYSKRIKQGVYQVSDSLACADFHAVHRIVTTSPLLPPVERILQEAAIIPQRPVTSAPEPIVSHVAPPEPVEAPQRAATQDSSDPDDAIEAVLDLLLPGGFQARHLKVVLGWVEATKTMIAEVGQ